MPSCFLGLGCGGMERFWGVFGVFFGVVTREAFYCGSGVNFGGFRHLGGDGGRPFVGSNLGLK